MRVNSEPIHNDISTLNTSMQAAPWKLGDPSSFQDLFSSGISGDTATTAATPAATTIVTPVPPAVPPAAPPAVPQAISTLTPPTFEQSAFVSGPDGSTTGLNPMEMASKQTADELAAKLGGTVKEENFAGGFSTSAPIRDITFSNSNVQINAGVAASLFAMYGDAQGSQAWKTINNDLGRDPSSTGPVS